ncbi:MAG: hypothetical protein K2Q20_13690 [Phycisphaerales bacterium]|nr:hypothetical protein [Phycisphaerales bacterium]
MRFKLFILIVAAVSFVLNCFPTHGPPEFRYTGADPARHVWNLGWPLATMIFDPRHGLHVGPMAWVLWPAQALVLLAGVAISLFARSKVRKRRGPPTIVQDSTIEILFDTREEAAKCFTAVLRKYPLEGDPEVGASLVATELDSFGAAVWETLVMGSLANIESHLSQSILRAGVAFYGTAQLNIISVLPRGSGYQLGISFPVSRRARGQASAEFTTTARADLSRVAELLDGQGLQPICIAWRCLCD